MPLQSAASTTNSNPRSWKGKTSRVDMEAQPDLVEANRKASGVEPELPMRAAKAAAIQNPAWISLMKKGRGPNKRKPETSKPNSELEETTDGQGVVNRGVKGKGGKEKARKKDNKKKVKVGDGPMSLDGRKYPAAIIQDGSSSESEGGGDIIDEEEKRNVTVRDRHSVTSHKQAPPLPSWVRPYAPSSRQLNNCMPAPLAPATSQLPGPSKAKHNKDAHQSDDENLMNEDGECGDNFVGDEDSEEDQLDGYTSDQDDMPGVDDFLNEAVVVVSDEDKKPGSLSDTLDAPTIATLPNSTTSHPKSDRHSHVVDLDNGNLNVELPGAKGKKNFRRRSRIVNSDDDGDNGNIKQPDTNIEGKRKPAYQKKLEAETAEVHNEPTSGAHAVETKAKRRVNTIDSTDDQPWLSRTDIQLSLEGRRYVVAMKRQSSIMQKILSTSFQLGRLTMVSSEIYSPLSADDLDEIAMEALINAADKLGYNGEYDVMHRLNEGSESDYKEPLRHCCFLRLTSHRGTIKEVASLIVPDKFGLDKHDSKIFELVAVLLENKNYIFPKTSPTVFNDKKPFQNPVIAAVISNYLPKFFCSKDGMNGLEFVSSRHDKPTELEVPIPMVALAATATAAVLADLQHGSKPSDFSGRRFENAYASHLGFLQGLRAHNRNAYHKLMHGLYVSAIGKTGLDGHALTEASFQSINWDAMDQDSD